MKHFREDPAATERARKWLTAIADTVAKAAEAIIKNGSAPPELVGEITGRKGSLDRELENTGFAASATGLRNQLQEIEDSLMRAPPQKMGYTLADDITPPEMSRLC